jgi:curved DNA-binding protein
VKSETVQARIPPGLHDGSVIRLEGQGEPGAGGAKAGDLYIRIRLAPHRLFSVVHDHDLQIDLPVAPWEAALGATVSVPTLDGPVDVKIPPGSQGGKRLRLQGKGLSTRRGTRGDLFARLKIVIPRHLTAREEELFKQLAAESRFDARDLLPGGSR